MGSGDGDERRVDDDGSREQRRRQGDARGRRGNE
jgi:hypothetical protein